MSHRRLIDAAKKGNVKKILELPGLVDEVEYDDRTALHWAAIKGVTRYSKIHTQIYIYICIYIYYMRKTRF